MTNTELVEYSESNKTEIAKILRAYYKQDPYLLEELREIVSTLLDDEISARDLEFLDQDLEELGSPWGLCASFIRPLSYKMIVSLRQYINKKKSVR